MPSHGHLVNSISVDVEDYFHAEALAGHVQREDWDSMPSRVETNTHRVLELLARHGARGTFFILGWVAKKFPLLVREIRDAGHEIACHSLWHRLIYRLTPEEFRADTREAKQRIEDTAGAQVFGYRAPTFSVTAQSLWALDILAEEGFTFDSSIYPIRHDFYGMPDYSRFVCQQTTRSGRLVEFPLATFRTLGTNWPFGGGGYLRIFPLAYTHWGFAKLNSEERQPVNVYFHPWELDPGQPRLPLGAKSRFRHYTNLGAMQARLDALLSRYKFAPMGELLAEGKLLPHPAAPAAAATSCIPAQEIKEK